MQRRINHQTSIKYFMEVIVKLKNQVSFSIILEHGKVNNTFKNWLSSPLQHWRKWIPLNSICTIILHTYICTYIFYIQISRRLIVRISLGWGEEKKNTRRNKTTTTKNITNKQKQIHKPPPTEALIWPLRLDSQSLRHTKLLVILKTLTHWARNE